MCSWHYAPIKCDAICIVYTPNRDVTSVRRDQDVCGTEIALDSEISGADTIGGRLSKE